MRCSVKDCKVCAKRGCNECKPGFVNKLGRCVKCKKKDVWDAWSRRCFRRRKNRYMDIHYNRAERYIQVSDLFSVGEDVTAIFDFMIQWRTKKHKPEQALFKITAIQGGVESDYYYNFVTPQKNEKILLQSSKLCWF